MNARTDLSAVDQAAAFHAAADTVNDSLIHDTLHAAGALVVSAGYVDVFDAPYISRWLDELWKAYVD